MNKIKFNGKPLINVIHISERTLREYKNKLLMNKRSKRVLQTLVIL